MKNAATLSAAVGLVIGCCVSMQATPAYAQQLMPPQRIAAFQRVLPKTEDPDLLEVFESKDSIWYTLRELEPRFQFTVFPRRRFGGQREGLSGHHSIYTQPSADSGGRPGHANSEYPWKTTLGGGSHADKNLRTAKAFLLPRASDGRILPVAVFGAFPVRWCFPNGTKFVEVAWLVRGKKWRPVEVRLREKEPDSWRTERYLPYQDRDDLVQFVAQTDEALASMIENGRRQRMRFRSLHPRPAINSTAIVQELPAIPTAIVNKILDRPFVPTAGWQYAENADGPTTNRSDSFRPKGDLTANHGSGSREQCFQCHNTSGRHARVFAMNRGWYGTVRGGGGGIMSWHPWPSRSPRQNANPRILRQAWVTHGIVAWFDANKHPAKHYTQDELQRAEIRRGVN